MRLLLDTQALLLWLDGGTRLSPRVRALIADRTNEVLISAASVFEITTKHRLGKLPAAGPLVLDFSGWTIRAGFAELPIGISHAVRAGCFPADHRDPFDRLLCAQSLVEALPIVSGDDALDGFGVQRIW